jgi:hypothetical protein
VRKFAPFARQPLFPGAVGGKANEFGSRGLRKVYALDGGFPGTLTGR